MSLQDDFDRAIHHARQGRFAEAAAGFAQVVRARPEWAEGYYNLGRALKDAGHIDEAADAYQRAVKLRPEFAAAWFNLGNLYFDREQNSEAAQAYENVVATEPQDADAWFHLGVTRYRLSDRDRAVEALRRATDLRPNDLTAFQHLAAALHDSGRLDEAATAYERILHLLPHDPSATYSLGLIKLAHADFANGWPAYEMRRLLPTFRTMRIFPQPEWNGEPLDNKIILLHAEQGLGDTIQFVRYAPRVAAAGGRVILVCPRQLVRLLQNRLRINEVFSDGDPLPPFDLHLPLMSLPRIFGTTLETIPSTPSYLQSHDEDRDFFRADVSTSKLKIGLCWSGNPANPTDKVRSVKLADLAPIANAVDASLFSLQMGPEVDQIKDASFELVDFHDRFTDLSKTAALISMLDLVITVDTSVAHLAAALGKPTWLLIAYASDWRWLLDRRDSPWYPSVRLFRQPAMGDWESVVQQVVTELKERRWKS